MMLFIAQGVMAQQATVEHKVKKKETLYGIARDYGVTQEQLAAVNPEMSNPGYTLKKGDVIKIPVVTNAQQPAQTGKKNSSASPAGLQTINLGVMLPLHDKSGDGRRMIEYYRGVLMACDSMKTEGISVNVHAWNLPEDGNVNSVLQNNKDAAKCDIIIGPLYSKFMDAMSSFVNKHDIMLVIPFSINAPQLFNNKHIFQIYQSPSSLNESTVRRCVDWFKDYHIVIIDCQDASSTKGDFTSVMRRQLDVDERYYNVTSLATADIDFARAFVADRPNLVVLNSAGQQQLNDAFVKLRNLEASKPNLNVSMFGYPEWMNYVDKMKQEFHLYSVYIPTYFYFNNKSAVTQRLQNKYYANFHQEMQNNLPRYALTGFDHAVFFLRGLHKYGKSFDGAAGRFSYQAVQTPLKFERLGGGGLQNRAYMFVHYKTDRGIETINY